MERFSVSLTDRGILICPSASIRSSMQRWVSSKSFWCRFPAPRRAFVTKPSLTTGRNHPLPQAVLTSTLHVFVCTQIFDDHKRALSQVGALFRAVVARWPARAHNRRKREPREWFSLLAPFRDRYASFSLVASWWPPFLLDTTLSHSYDRLLIECL